MWIAASASIYRARAGSCCRTRSTGQQEDPVGYLLRRTACLARLSGATSRSASDLEGSVRSCQGLACRLFALDSRSDRAIRRERHWMVALQWSTVAPWRGQMLPVLFILRLSSVGRHKHRVPRLEGEPRCQENRRAATTSTPDRASRVHCLESSIRTQCNLLPSQLRT